MNRSLCLIGILLIILSFILRPTFIKADSGFDSSWDSESSSYGSSWDNDDDISFSKKIVITLYVVPIFIATCSIIYIISSFPIGDKLYEFLTFIVSFIIIVVEVYFIHNGEYLIVLILCLLLMLIAYISHKLSKKNEKRKGVKNEK